MKNLIRFTDESLAEIPINTSLFTEIGFIGSNHLPQHSYHFVTGIATSKFTPLSNYAQPAILQTAQLEVRKVAEIEEIFDNDIVVSDIPKPLLTRVTEDPDEYLCVLLPDNLHGEKFVIPITVVE